MSNYYIMIQGKDFYVTGCEAAYEAFYKACEFGDYLGLIVVLCDAETGEVLADSNGYRAEV